MYEYLWHIHIDDSSISLSMFNDFCQNILKLIGSRVVSLRLRLTNVIGGWSLVSSSLRYHQITLLQRLHLIDIEPHEFDKLLRNHLIKQLHTLLVDVTENSLFHDEIVEGFYLAKVCSQLPLLRNCRLPFNHNGIYANELEKHSLTFPLSLPNLSNTNNLRILTIGVHTLRFVECLLLCIPFIENLSVGIYDFQLIENNGQCTISLPNTVNFHLRNLSRLHLYCADNSSFHRAIALFSSVFGQLSHLSLKLKAYTLISGPLTISGDIIQQLCIDCLKPCATYILNLLLCVEDDLQEKIIFNRFLKVPFVHRERPRVHIQERDNWDIGGNYHCFMVYTSPCNDTILRADRFSTNLKRSCQTSIIPVDLFPHANELFLCNYKKKNCLSELVNCSSSISSMVPWSLLTKITIDEDNVVTIPVLESILRMAFNVHTLEIYDDREGLLRAILRNNNNLGTRVNEQIKSLSMNHIKLTLQNAQRFCILLSNRLPNLQKVSFNICASYDRWKWVPSRIVDGKNKSTKRIVNLIYYLADHLQQLVSLYITFADQNIYETPCFPHLIRQQLHRYPLSRPYRLRCSPYVIQIWL